jgi:adenosylcobyric acid synthase
LTMHGGNRRRLAQAAGGPEQDLLDFSASINPLGPPKWLPEVVLANLRAVEHYPDPECLRLVEAISARYSVAPERVVVGNGSAEIIAALPRVLGGLAGGVPGVTRAVIPVPAYGDYTRAAAQAGLAVRTVALDETKGFALDGDEVGACLEAGDMVFMGRPNNPTGTLCAREDLLSLAARHPGTWFFVDEAFVEFVLDEAGAPDPGLLGVDLPNLVVVRSLTKLYAIPGLRLGFVVASPVPAAALRRALVPWSVNALAQAVGVAALADEEYVRATRDFVVQERGRLAAELSALSGLQVFPGSANYLLVRVSGGQRDAVDLAARLLQRGIAIRACDDFEGLDGSYFRVAVRTAEEDDRLLAELRSLLAPRRSATTPIKET